MKKRQLENQTDKVVTETREALQTVYDALNPGQKKQIVKNAAVKVLFYRYKVNVEAK